MHSITDYKVSVVMPVYNAAAYVEAAVLSVIDLPETGEVLLIDDASTDDSLNVCRALEKKHEKIIVLEHPDRKNHGAAASRNAGIVHARFDYIAFLDSDDYYLPNRFTTEKEIFLTEPDVDGVYGCNLAIFENDEAKRKFLSRYESEFTTFRKKLKPEELFKPLLFGGYGRFHTSAITLHKRAFEKAGLFNPGIRYVEDTELWLKLSLKSTLVAGSIDEPVSIRRVHDTNSIHQIDKVEQYSKQMYQALFDWALQQSFPFETTNDFFIALHRFAKSDEYPVKRLFWEQVKHRPSMMLRPFFFKKIHQLYFTR